MQLTTQFPTSIGLIGGRFYISLPGVHESCWIYVNGTIVWAREESQTEDLRVGSIETIPVKDMTGENNCHHIKFDGNCRRVRTDWFTIVSGDANRLDDAYVRLAPPGPSNTFLAAAILKGATGVHGARATLQPLSKSDWPRWYEYNDLVLEVKPIGDMGYELWCTSHVIYHNLYSGTDTDLGVVSKLVKSGSLSSIIDVGDQYRPSGPPPVSMFLPSESETDYIEWLIDGQHDYGALSRVAAANVRALDINSIAYIKDFTELFTLAKSLTALSQPHSAWIKGAQALRYAMERAIKEGKMPNNRELKKLKRKLNRSLAREAMPRVRDTYLASHYGLKLTILDTEEIAAAIDSIDIEAHRRSTAGGDISGTVVGGNGKQVSYNRHAKITYKSYTNDDLSFMEAYKRMGRIFYDLDLLPTLSNVWDLVPFSFIFDWLLPIGETLEQIETNEYAALLSVTKACYSTKYEWYEAQRFQTEIYEYSLSGTYRVYSRTVRPNLIISPPKYDRAFASAKDLGSHWLEALAIAYGKGKKLN